MIYIYVFVQNIPPQKKIENAIDNKTFIFFTWTNTLNFFIVTVSSLWASKVD